MPPKRRISRTSGRRSSNTMDDKEEEVVEEEVVETTMVVDMTPAKSSKKRKTDPDEMSVGSRSSARLKRKRDASIAISSLNNNNNNHTASTILNFDTVLEEEDDDDNDNDPAAKRTKVDRSTETAPTTMETPLMESPPVVVPQQQQQQQHPPVVVNDHVVVVTAAASSSSLLETTTATVVPPPFVRKPDEPPVVVMAAVPPSPLVAPNIDAVSTANDVVVEEVTVVLEDPPAANDNVFHRIQQAILMGRDYVRDDVYPSIFTWYHTVVVPRWRQILDPTATATHDDNVTTTTDRGKYHQSTLFWCAILLVLQMVAYPIWIHPILSTTVALSRVLVSMYDQVVVVRGGSRHGGRSFDAQVALETVQQLQVALQSLTQQEQSRHDELLHWTTALTIDDDDDTIKTTTTTTNMTHLVHQYEEMIQSRIAELSNTIQRLESFDPKQNQSTALEIISDRSTNVFLLDLTRSDFLDDMTKNRNSTTAANCGSDHPITNSDTALLQHSEMEQAVQDLQREIHEIINTTIMTSASTMEEIRQWIRLEVERVTPSNAVTDRPNDNDNNIARTIVTQQIRMKQQQLSVTDVDENETKIIDYASVVQGGTILYATPSLMQTLPILNRILARLQWRFYGHSAEMILTPKITTRRDPTNRNPMVLGQCWSFPRTKAAVVVIQLGGGGGAGIDVASVAVEHPLVSSDRDTAIQTFHVSGLPNASSYHHPDQNDANNEWFDLGTFSYDGSNSIPGTNGLVEFPISPKSATTTTIPPLQIIRLQIDPIGNDITPNQKYSYSCLYRFRVNGRPASLE